MADTYRVGIIGCGSIANLHARGYQGLDNVEMVALADPVQAAADAFGDQYGIENRYTDFRQMLDEENPDIVSNATWHKLHAPITIAICARQPRAVLCEKPMATSMGECNEMMIAAERNGVKLAIGHQRRFNPAWNDARDLIADGAIGQLLQELGGEGRQGGTFYGSDGILDLDEARVRLLSGRTGRWEERRREGEEPSVAQARELVDWIEGKVKHRGRAENGMAAVEIIMAIYESARMHEVVTMPVRTQVSPLDLMIDDGALPVERPGRYDIRAFLLRGEAVVREEGWKSGRGVNCLNRGLNGLKDFADWVWLVVGKAVVNGEGCKTVACGQWLVGKGGRMEDGKEGREAVNLYRAGFAIGIHYRLRYPLS